MQRGCFDSNIAADNRTTEFFNSICLTTAFPWLFVTDAPSRVLSFDLRQNPLLTVSEVTTLAGESTRADELAYNPRDGLILAINNASTPPFATLVKVDTTTGALTVVKNIFFDTAHGVDAQNGAEQPVWDPETKKFYLFIPQLGPNPRREQSYASRPPGRSRRHFRSRFAHRPVSHWARIRICSSAAIRFGLQMAAYGPGVRT